MARRFQQGPSGDSPVSQGHLRETNINRIVERAKANGLPLPSGARQPLWGNFDAGDFMAAQNLLVQVRTEFAELPARVRNLFDNDPRQLIAFVQDPANEQKALELGLRTKGLPPPKTLGQEVAEALAPLLPVQEDLEEHSRRSRPKDRHLSGHSDPLD